MTLGPIDLVVLGFPGSRFTGEIRPRIEELIDQNIVNLIDALFITKDADGNTGFYELAEISDDPEATALGEHISSQLDLLSDEDADSFADELAPGSSALALVFEHTWMRPVRDAIAASGGVLIADARIPGDVVDEVLAAVDQL
jgi:uncharacterized membrane protein